MTHLAPYPSYRDSGLPWLGQIPAHWEVKRLKFVAPASTNKLTDKPDDLPYVGLENIESGTGRLLMETQPETVESNVGIFEKGDILFGKLRPYLAKVAEADFQGSCTTEILALRPQKVYGRFLFYSLLSPRFIEFVNSMTYGTKMPRASWEQIGNLVISIPPLPEQRTIAAFLDRQTAKIDALIAKKQRLLDLLREKRAALISQAVTKGLPPSPSRRGAGGEVRMKDSGVAWLGQVPSHWEIDLVKRHFDIDLGKMLDSSKQPENGFLKPYLRAANIYWEGVWLDDVNEMKFTKEQLKRYRLQKGDLLVTEGGVTVGRSTIWQDELEEVYYQNSINRARPKGTLPVKFLYYWLYALKLTGFIDNVVSKATFGHLTKDKLELLQMTVPPKQEAEQIAEHLDIKLLHIARVEDKIKDVIERLHEYRAALISSTVTGKIQVKDEG